MRASSDRTIHGMSRFGKVFRDKSTLFKPDVPSSSFGCGRRPRCAKLFCPGRIWKKPWFELGYFQTEVSPCPNKPAAICYGRRNQLKSMRGMRRLDPLRRQLIKPRSRHCEAGVPKNRQYPLVHPAVVLPCNSGFTRCYITCFFNFFANSPINRWHSFRDRCTLTSTLPAVR